MSVTTIDVPLTEEQDAFVSAKAEREGYQSPGAFIQTVVEKARLDEAYEAEIEAKILGALNSEHPGIVVTPEYWQEKRSRLKAASRTSTVKHQMNAAGELRLIVSPEADTDTDEIAL